MKRTKLKKVSKQPISKIQKLLWDECKRIIRARFKHNCYTCGAKNLTGTNLQTGHMWAKASLGAFLKYDLRVLRPQCARCNLWMGGMGADFYKRILKENGEEFIKQLEQDRNITVNAHDHYVKLLELYKTIKK
jgi:hypothetical protein